MDTQKIFENNPKIAYICVYTSGFVPNSYKWPAPGKMTVYYRDGKQAEKTYDRKRTNGIGPAWVAFSEKNGRLASG